MATGYRFVSTEEGFEVYYRGKALGTICPYKEASGRHCFYLGCDDRREPRTYRGKTQAAEALHAIRRLMSDAERQGWSTEKLLVVGWDRRPRASNGDT